MDKRRVVVTGLGAVTPLGNSVSDTWDGIRNERCVEKGPPLLQAGGGVFGEAAKVLRLIAPPSAFEAVRI